MILCAAGDAHGALDDKEPLPGLRYLRNGHRPPLGPRPIGFVRSHQQIEETIAVEVGCQQKTLPSGRALVGAAPVHVEVFVVHAPGSN